MKILKKWIANFLKDIEKAYGDKKLDCCELNPNQYKNLGNYKKQK